jgi:predicted ferric reductase
MKRYSIKNGMLWLAIFFLLAVLPVLVSYLGELPPIRGFLEELGVALGFMGLSLFGLQFLFSGRIAQVAPAFGVDNIVQFHKEIGVIAILFALAHPVFMLLADSSYISFFDPRENLPRAISLILASIGMVFLLLTSLWRLSFGLSYEVWRLLHGGLAALVLFVGVVHSIQVGHYLDPLWKIIFVAALFLAYGYLLIHTRLVRPIKNLKKPYEITEVKPKRDDSYTLVLKAVKGSRMIFEPGQFVWITIHGHPFSLQQHPFSISSSKNDATIAITAKRLGDFTNTWKNLEAGQRAFLEGPLGSFTLKEKPCFMIMGGIGVTPAISMLRTLADKQDNRKCILIYGNENEQKIPFKEDLEELGKKINLKVVHVLEEPGDNWKGEEGLIDPKLIKSNLPESINDFDYYICGPEPMMDVAELTLRKAGVAWENIYAERFDLA